MKKTISYDKLLSELELENVREVEDLIIKCFYDGLLKGKLDQRGKELRVKSAIGRDIEPSAIDDMLEKLEKWRGVAEAAIDQLGNSGRFVRQSRLDGEEKNKGLQARVKELSENMEKEAAKKSGARPKIRSSLGSPLGQ